jgi:squalene cyclase
MSDILRKIVAVVLCVISMASGAMAATQQDIDNARAKGLAWLISNQNGDGSWKAAAGLEVQSTATALEALMNAGITQGFDYGAAVSWLKNTDPSSV